MEGALDKVRHRIIINIMAKLDEFKSLVNSAPITEGDKAIWLRSVDGIGDFFLEQLVIVFSEMPDQIVWLTENSKKKTAALAAGDKQEWEKIVEDEKEVFGRLATKIN